MLPSDETTVPSKAEDEQGDAQEGGHSVPDQGAGMAGTEVETKPEGSGQGKQLTGQKIHLRWGWGERDGGQYFLAREEKRVTND